MVVYYDELFVINFILNSVILYLTAWSIHVPISKLRMFSGAGIGSVYALGELLPSGVLFYTPLSKLLFMTMLIAGVFGRQSLKRFGLLVVLFFVNSFILGGAVMGWFYFFQSFPLQLHSPPIVITVYHLVGGVVVGMGLLGIWSRSFTKTFSRKNISYQLKICYEGRVLELTSLLDTGNRLYSPLGHKPVIIVDIEALAGLLSNKVMQYLIMNHNKLPETIQNIPDSSLMARLEIIPYQGVGVKNLFVGFRPDWVEIQSVRSQVIIALSPVHLSPEHAYQALIHPDIVPVDNHHEREAHVCA
ncbi:stage II sporulation protein GA (sporulation sigma-E factor processing peptidase) [Sporomusaceae bacterium BoRhaA]|uniref:sigma-E processing peptidase SpoIIGA n=1 Tax=Pelorhabdus rhamnosifermentans TaxID=2772457 RepID=UPI001C063C20|nr:sigma-E processing peptidase SpoIIGA [Pelorhabdus rhamnosifermentans]MBU2700159.1 stage II sporulation protein GA (sporulation sigma-E factor processing peptidase) [Pelorhabdus rhamnosifermentans]